VPSVGWLNVNVFLIAADSSKFLFFRAIAFSRLFDWKVAALTDDGAAAWSRGTTPVKKAHRAWSSVTDFEGKATRERMRCKLRSRIMFALTH
jgi:hypothetical protein